MQRFMRESHEVALKILRGLAIGLQLPEDFFLEVRFRLGISGFQMAAACLPRLYQALFAR
jgi:isopenicillin N synthase-like dioxygenase